MLCYVIIIIIAVHCYYDTAGTILLRVDLMSNIINKAFNPRFRYNTNVIYYYLIIILSPCECKIQY